MSQPEVIPPGQRGVSESLRRFAQDLPEERNPILAFVADVATHTPPGASVLDVGAGDAPYRELFKHVNYMTSDWAESMHPGATAADVIAPADALPLEDETFQLVVCTEVLEHVPEPSAALSEFFRLLQPGGRLALTVPFVWELHELPHDYYRYTEPGLRYLLGKAGFANVEITARSDGFTTLAQLLRNLSWTTGDADDGLSDQREEAREVLEGLAGQLAGLAPLDVRNLLPLGYSALASKR